MNDDTIVSGDVQPDSASVAASTEETTETTKVEAPKGEETKTDQNAGDKPDPAKDDAAASEAAKTLSRRKQTMQERLSEVTHARREAERRATKAETELAQLKGKQAPKAEDYDDVGKLTADQVNHTLDQRRVSELESVKTDANEEIMKNRAIAWTARVEDFSPTVTDFETVVRSAPLDDKTSELIVDLEEGPQVAYHLGKNHAEARRISALPPLEKAVALGRLVERLNATPARRTTQAPEPVNAVHGKNAGKSDFDPEKASMSDYAAKRKAGWG